MYMIPNNVQARYEIFPGFGMIELLMTVVGSAIGIAVFFILNFIRLPLVISVVVGVLFPVIAFLLSMSNPKTGLSLLTMIKHFREYRERQNRYFYVFGTGRLEDA